MNNFRPKGSLGIGKRDAIGEQSSPNENAQYYEEDLTTIFDSIKDLKIDGDKKRLIKIDEKSEEILKVLYPVFSVDVTRFINFLISRFFEEHPEIVKQIKKSFKKL